MRPATKEQVESLGAKFVAVEDEEFKQAETAGGYAKEMSDAYKAKQAALVAAHIAKQDIVIATALIPGRPAPRLVSADMVKSMRAGSVIVDLAVERGVSASTQNHAFSAILFLFRRVLGHDLGNLSATLRAKRVRRLPVVLSHEEIARLLAAAEGTTGLMIRLMYGTGMRLMECLQLRVKEVDFERNSILIRAGKGNKDRTVMLPEKLKEFVIWEGAM